MRRYRFDIETNGLLDELDTVHSLAIQDVDSGYCWSCCDHEGYESPNGHDTTLDIKAGIELLEEADELIGHNIIKFDIPAIQKVFPWFTPNGKITDTLNASRLIWTDLFSMDMRFAQKNQDFPKRLLGRHSLEAWGARLGCPKDDYSKRMKEKGLDPWAEWNPMMQSYCEQDVLTTGKFHELIVSKNYSEEALELEMDFQQIIAKQERTGFPFDVDHAQKLYATLSVRRMELEQELRDTFKSWWVGTEASFARSSTRFIPCPKGKERRYKRTTPKGTVVSKVRSQMSDKVWTTHDWEFEGRGYFSYEDEGAQFLKIKRVEFNPGSRDHIADRLIKLRGWKPKAFGKDGKPTVDDAVISKLNYPEAKLIAEYLMVQKRIGQLAEGNQALLKVVKDDNRIHGEVCTNGAVTGRCTHSRPNVAQTPAVGVPYGREFRACYTAPPGWVLVGADASGLELRCLAHYMGRWDGGAYTQLILHGDIHTANQEAAGLPTRSNAKTFIYAFLYGAGDEKIGSIVGKGARAGATLKKKFLNGLPALNNLVNGVQRAVKTRGHLVGLDGRILHVRSAHAALNTLLQSAGAVVMKKALVLLEAELQARGLRYCGDYAYVANVHDEFQIICKPELGEEIGSASVDAIRRAGEHFEFRCPLDGDFKVGNTWADTH